MRALARYWKQMALVAETRAQRLEAIQTQRADAVAMIASLPKPPASQRAERNILIDKLSSQGWSNRSIARKVGLHEVTVCRILRRSPPPRPANDAGGQGQPQADEQP